MGRRRACSARCSSSSSDIGTCTRASHGTPRQAGRRPARTCGEARRGGSRALQRLRECCRARERRDVRALFTRFAVQSSYPSPRKIINKTSSTRSVWISPTSVIPLMRSRRLGATSSAGSAPTSCVRARACCVRTRPWPGAPARNARFPLSPLLPRAESVSYPEQRALALTATSKIGCAR